MRALATNQHLSRYLIHPIEHAVDTPASDYHNLICSTRLPSILQPRQDTQQPLSYLINFFPTKTHSLSTQAKGISSSPPAHYFHRTTAGTVSTSLPASRTAMAPEYHHLHSHHHLFFACADHAHRLRLHHPDDIKTRRCPRREVDGALC